MDLAGLPVTLLDTAGLRDSVDAVEVIGIDRAITRAKAADLRVFLTEDGKAIVLDPVDGDIVVASKADLRADALGVSGLTGKGVDALVAQISDTLVQRAEAVGVATHAVTDVRCQTHLRV